LDGKAGSEYIEGNSPQLPRPDALLVGAAAAITDDLLNLFRLSVSSYKNFRGSPPPLHECRENHTKIAMIETPGLRKRLEDQQIILLFLFGIFFALREMSTPKRRSVWQQRFSLWMTIFP
jgi:hypothetical protein